MHTVLIALAAVAYAASCSAAPDAASFARPAPERHPETWFHLIGGNVARVGLDADLDAVKAAGISGIQLFHGQFGGPWPGVSPQIPCLSADWDDLIRFVAEGCARRGLSFKMQNCPGWSMSGGPWIKPEMAMRNLSFSRVNIPGGTAAGALPKPNWQMECRLKEPDLDYRDLFVLAFPTPDGDDGRAWTPKPAEATDAGGILRRVYRFDAPRLVRSITLPCPRQMNSDYIYRLEAHVRLVAGTGAERATVLDEEIPQGTWQDGVPLTFACDERVSDIWTLEIAHRHPMRLHSVTFRSGARLDNWEGQAGWVLRGLVRRPAPLQSAASYVRSNEVLDLTDRFHDDVLSWTAPTGRMWTVLRIGHVNNGTRNGPAPKEATGWECNKMDRRAIDLHFNSYIGRLAKGPLAGGLLKGFVVDSWECRRQTWTESMESDFRMARGYDIRHKLPAVFGWVLDDPATTARILLDWRKTLGELVERNYYARLDELAHANGLTAQYETAFGDVIPGDLMRFWKGCDVPMCEFWHPHAAGSVGQDDYKPVLPCASASHIYGKGRVAAESFTSLNLKWNEDPKALKRTGNHALARGVTHLVFHTYTHNPRTDALPPGTSFGHTIGTPFVRGQTWWGAMREFTDYFARCETMLETGLPCSDVLWFLGDEVGHKPSEISPLPDGFKYDYCNQDALLTRVTARDGKATLPDGVRYEVLWMPKDTYVAPESEAKLRALAAAGVRVVRGAPEAAVKGLAPDVIVGANARAVPTVAPPLEWIHRTSADSDWYFVSANGPRGYKGDVSFRATGDVQLWDPVTGEVCTACGVESVGERTRIAFDFESGESVFVVFSKRGATHPTVDKPHADGPSAEVCGWRISFPQGWGAPEEMSLDALKSWTELPLGEEGRHFSGTATYRTTLRRDAAGMVTLDLGRVESVATVYVNGRKVRTLWAPPYRCTIALEAGANELRVEVTNTWFNRLVYDAGLPEAQRKTWTLGAPKKDAKLEPSGLLGPVVLR